MRRLAHTPGFGVTGGRIYGLSAHSSMDTHLAMSKKDMLLKGDIPKYVLSYETFSDFSVMYSYCTKEIIKKNVYSCAPLHML